jgi:hypothetical protein
MASSKKSDRERSEMAERVEARLRELCSEDDFAGALDHSDHYPTLETRDLSSFERDLRDWGMVYGLAFGLAISMAPDMPHEDAAGAVFHPAYRVYVNWGGEIEDPGVKRERAIQMVTRRWEEADRRRFTDGKLRPDMTEELQGAIMDLSEWARG